MKTIMTLVMFENHRVFPNPLNTWRVVVLEPYQAGPEVEHPNPRTVEDIWAWRSEQYRRWLRTAE